MCLYFLRLFVRVLSVVLAVHESACLLICAFYVCLHVCCVYVLRVFVCIPRAVI